MVIRHTCDNPRCINPQHLIAGTQADNIRDKVERGRQSLGRLLEHAKLDEAKAAYIKAHYIPRHKEFGARAMARKFGVTHDTIRRVLIGKTFKEV